jgi:hypothetical protein
MYEVMNTRISRRELAIDLCSRSACYIKMAAVCSDSSGIFAWGWNSSGRDGYGQHAEEHAISRANRKRLKDCVVTIAGLRHRKGGVSGITHERYHGYVSYVFACPCKDRCWPLLQAVGVKTIEFIHPDGHWTFYRLPRR